MNTPAPIEPTADTPSLLTIVGLKKRFGSTQALDGVDLELHQGEVVALLGGNGAGKSTLIKTLAGLNSPDEGSLQIDGEEVPWSSHLSAIAFVHQDPALVGDMTVAENIALAIGFPRNRLNLVSWERTKQQAQQALEIVDLRVPVDTPMDRLGPAESTLVAIARALSQTVRILVLDEPTAGLGPHEVQTLFSAVRRLCSRGVGVIYVSHRLDEVLELADRVVVLRNGRSVLEGDTASLTAASLAEAVAGRVLSDMRAVRSMKLGDARRRLWLQDVVAGEAGPVTIDAYAGQVTALTGVVGAGQHAVSRLLRGEEPLHQGRLEVNGRSFARPTAASMSEHGVSFTPTNRTKAGIAPNMTVSENLLCGPKATEGRVGWLSRSNERRASARLVADYDIRPPRSDVLISNLSGGNQQKVVVARAMYSEPSLVVLDDPTIGVDIGARAQLYVFLRAAAQQGLAVVVVSTDLEEVELIADRAIVFRKGMVVADLAGDEITESSLLEAALVEPAGELSTPSRPADTQLEG